MMMSAQGRMAAMSTWVPRYLILSVMPSCGDADGRHAFGAVADHDESCVDMIEDALEDANDVGDAFDGTEVGDVHNDLFAFFGECAAFGRLWREFAVVEKV